jgi:hypothetical protein
VNGASLKIRSRYSPQDGRCLREAIGSVAGKRVCGQHMETMLKQKPLASIYCHGFTAGAFRFGKQTICGGCGKTVKVAA